MKKQKPPVILASVLVVLFGVIFALSWQRKEDPQEQMQQAMKDVPLTTAARPAPTKDELRKSAKKESETVEIGMDPAAVDRTRPRRPHEPTIFLTEMKTQKPKPNASSISTQWYKDESESSKE